MGIRIGRAFMLRKFSSNARQRYDLYGWKKIEKAEAD
jgi:hypothetical protein